MSSIDGLKTCRKGLHQYSSDLKHCPECKKTRDREYSRHWREQNPERHKEIFRQWREQNSARQKENVRRWRDQNPERQKENCRRWKEQNPEKVNALNAKRRSAKKRAIAPWADLDAIKQIYTEAAELTKSTGIRYEVDHIYPLQSDYMCGLHVETNLQILTQAENASKKNRIWPEQLDCQRLPIQQHGFNMDA